MSGKHACTYLREHRATRPSCELVRWALGQLEPQAAAQPSLLMRSLCRCLRHLASGEVMPHIHNLDDGLFHRNAGCGHVRHLKTEGCICPCRYRLVATQALANLGPQAVHTRKARGRCVMPSCGLHCACQDHLLVMESTDRDDDALPPASQLVHHKHRALLACLRCSPDVQA